MHTYLQTDTHTYITKWMLPLLGSLEQIGEGGDENDGGGGGRVGWHQKNVGVFFPHK